MWDVIIHLFTEQIGTARCTRRSFEYLELIQWQMAMQFEFKRWNMDAGCALINARGYQSIGTFNYSYCLMKISYKLFTNSISFEFFGLFAACVSVWIVRERAIESPMKTIGNQRNMAWCWISCMIFFLIHCKSMKSTCSMERKPRKEKKDKHMNIIQFNDVNFIRAGWTYATNVCGDKTLTYRLYM